ncbi:MAG: hypothetical protein GXY76_17330 [Chloroflexi bacterium]|nr:hypothetical protein [Chloroflexota bacterium]
MASMSVRFRRACLFALALLALLAACESGPTPTAAPEHSAYATQAPAEVSPTGAALSTETPGVSYAYLPAQRTPAARRRGEPARIVWEGQPLELVLLDLAEPPDATPQPAVKALITAFQVTNRGASRLQVDPARLFAGMNSLDLPLELAPVEPLSLPVGEPVLLKLRWTTALAAGRLRLWITANMPVLSSGYVGVHDEGAVFSFYLDEIEYPQGTPTPCTMAVQYVRESPEDRLTVAPGARFDKTWVLANGGTCRWPEGSRWALYTGEGMGLSQPLALSSLPAAGALLTVTLPMTAPLVPGEYVSEWALLAPSGQFYGRTFQMRVTVAASSATP